MDNRVKLTAALLRIFEGLKLSAYLDSGGVWTIGYGHTAGVVKGDICTEQQAEDWLSVDSSHLFAMTAHINPVAAAAYISFGYNCGASRLAAVLAGSDAISNPIHCTDRHGVVLAGLQARRALETALIESSSEATS